MDVPLAVSPEMLAIPHRFLGDSRSNHRAHLVGAAGCGMRALSDVLAGWGWQISGSDCSTAAMAPPGMRLFHGHAAEQLSPDTALVVYSDAVPSDNPELCRARELGIPTISYFQMLGRLSAERHTVAVAGTHGKSTTTAMVAHILIEAGRDPTVFCGATPLGATSGGRAGGDELFIVEACEYRANFLNLRPTHAAILGIEPDHFDCYETLPALENAFRQFADLAPAHGMLLVRHDCRVARRVTCGRSCRVESFGFSPEADWSAGRLEEHLGRFRFEIGRFGERLCEVSLPTPGRHNVLNALAAAALAWHNGASAEHIARGLGGFAGVHRRLERLADWRGAAVIDDYAHHPTEVVAALEAVRGMFPGRRVWCVFQPHQASRTARLLGELAASLQNADKLLVAEIFRAREGVWRPGEVTAADLAQEAGRLGVEVFAVHRAEEIVETLETHLVPGDVLVTLGAGDVGKLHRPTVGRCRVTADK